VNEALWLKGLPKELKVHSFIVYYNSRSVIQLFKNQVYHERTKYIGVKLHFVREDIVRGPMKMMKVSTDYNDFDMILKIFPGN